MKKILKWVGITFGVLFLMGMCANLMSDDDVTNELTEVKEEPKEVIDTVKVKEEIKALKSKFIIKADEFTGNTWVEHKNNPKYRNSNGIYLYFAQNNEGKSENLRLVLQYYAEDWLFINKAIFNIDGKNYTLAPIQTEHDNENGYIWEWCDLPVTYGSSLLEAINNAKTVKVRYYGSQYEDTKKMSETQLKTFKEVYKMYKLMSI